MNLTEHPADQEDTAELPVLSEEAMLKLESMALQDNPDSAGRLAESVESLQTALERAESRWREMEARLGPPGGSPDKPELQAESGRAAESSNLAERIAMLEAYITGRAAHWRDMEVELDAGKVRIAELETEIGQRIERESRLERCLRDQEERSQRLRSRLRILNQHLTTPAPARTSVPALICIDSQLRVRYPLNQPQMMIGRSPDCDIQILTDVVSRKHAAIHCDASGILIEDHSSTNGVFVNGRRVRRVKLEPGDEIRIGEVRFRMAYCPS